MAIVVTENNAKRVAKLAEGFNKVFRQITHRETSPFYRGYPIEIIAEEGGQCLVSFMGGQATISADSIVWR